MKKFINALLWILTTILIILGIVFIKSFFGIICFITAILLAPIDEWQEKIHKFIKKPFLAIAISLLTAFIVALFPLADLVTNIRNSFSPPPSSEKVIVYYEESAPVSSAFEKSCSTSSDTTSYKSNETSSEKAVTSITQVPSSSSETKSSETKTNETKTSEISSQYIESVFRTPTGKRYHYSPTCGGKNSYGISLDEALDAGLTPCKRCAK